MLLLRQLTSKALTSSHTTSRFYAKKVGNQKVMERVHKDVKQVHQETLRHISPCARINILSDIYVKVRTIDVHDYPNGDVLIAALHGGHVRNTTATMKVHVSEDEEQVDVVLTRVAEHTDFHGEFEVPIRATLNIKAKDSVSVRDIKSNEVCVEAVKNIKVRELLAERISLHSAVGNIHCEGCLLGKNTDLETHEQGNIILDKVLGENFSCKTQMGQISTGSCYASASKFETDTGCLQLKNVHNSAQVFVHQNGDLQMTGVHGNLNVRSNGGSINIQLSELNGESAIVASGVTAATVTISDKIEKGTCVEVTASEGVQLDSNIAHLQDYLCEDKHAFRLAQENDVNKLKVFVEGSSIKLGKSSWADTIRAKFSTDVEQ